MTDSLSHPNSDAAACAQFEERLMAYLEGELPSGDRAWMDAHRAECVACDAIVTDLTSLVAQAAALPAFAPDRDLWEGISARIDAPVVALPFAASASPVAQRSLSFPSPRHGVSVRWFAVAATLLVAVSSAVTWRIARTRPDAIVAATATDTQRLDAARRTRVVPAANAGVVYEQEISALRTIVNERLGELDSTTVKVLKHNLDIIDQAILESRAALAKDPHSRVLSTTLDRALESKLTLMRRVALL